MASISVNHSPSRHRICFSACRSASKVRSQPSCHGVIQVLGALQSGGKSARTREVTVCLNSCFLCCVAAAWPEQAVGGIQEPAFLQRVPEKNPAGEYFVRTS